jgi:hypothetical protein
VSRGGAGTNEAHSATSSSVADTATWISGIRGIDLEERLWHQPRHRERASGYPLCVLCVLTLRRE